MDKALINNYMATPTNFLQSPFNKARKDKFLLVLNFPDGLKEIFSKLDRANRNIIPDSLQFSVYGVVVPDMEVSHLDVRYGGQTLAASSQSRKPYPPITVNFDVDNRFNNYWVIYKWLNILNDVKLNIFNADNLVPPPGSNNSANFVYAANLSIFALDEYDKRTVEFKYLNAFPTTLGGVNFNHRDSGEVESFVTFSYSQLVISLVEDVDIL